MSAALAGLVHLTHPDLPGASALVSADPVVVEHYAARGWVPAPVPAELDPDAPNRDAPAAAAPAAAAQVVDLAPEQPAPPAKPTKTSTATPAADDTTGA